jgi:hypothetical protein
MPSPHVHKRVIGSAVQQVLNYHVPSSLIHHLYALACMWQHPAIVNAIGIGFEGDNPGEGDATHPPGALFLVQEHLKVCWHGNHCRLMFEQRGSAQALRLQVVAWCQLPCLPNQNRCQCAPTYLPSATTLSFSYG